MESEKQMESLDVLISDAVKILESIMEDTGDEELSNFLYELVIDIEAGDGPEDVKMFIDDALEEMEDDSEDEDWSEAYMIVKDLHSSL